MRTARPQTIEIRSPRLADRIVRGVFAPTPPVKNDQHDRTALLHLPTSSAARRLGEACQPALMDLSNVCVGSRWHRQPVARFGSIRTGPLLPHGGDFCSTAR